MMLTTNGKDEKNRPLTGNAAEGAEVKEKEIFKNGELIDPRTRLSIWLIV